MADNVLMAGIGADASDFNKELEKVEKKIRRLESQREIEISIGGDTSTIDRNLERTRARLDQLRSATNSTGQAFQQAQRPIANAGNTLTNFSRIAQDAPFGLMGIGNNITATVEAFGSLSQASGGAGGAFRALGATLMGPGGIIFAVSAVVSAFTVMSQKGITVADGVDFLTGKYDGFKKALSEVNKEAAKNAAEQINSVGAYVSAAQDINLSMKDRLIAVKKLQDEYPAFFGNLSKEQILNGNVATAVKDVTAALIAKAKAQAASGKLGELAAKEVELKEKEEVIQRKLNESLAERNRLADKFDKTGKDFLAEQSRAAGVSAEKYKGDLADIKEEIKGVTDEMDKWAKKYQVEVKASIKIDFKEEPVKKAKKVKVPKEKIKKAALTQAQIMAIEMEEALKLIAPPEVSLPFIVPAVDEKFQAMLESMRAFNNAANDIITNNITSTFEQLGTSIGEALATGGNVLSAVGMSILQSLGNFLSEMGGMLIKYGTLAVVKGKLDLAILTGGPLSIAAGLAAIGVGVALKAAGGAIGTFAKSGSSKSGGNVSAGNSVSSPTSSVNNNGGGSGWSNVVFEISGQSLVGVLSNTLNKNVKMGGAMPAI